MTDLLQQDATAQAEAIARGDISPSELLEAAVARVDALNPSLNFIAQDLRDMARARTGQPFSGPFAGVPFLVKDLQLEVRSRLQPLGPTPAARLPPAPRSVPPPPARPPPPSLPLIQLA